MKKSTLILLISTAIFFTSTLVLLYLNYLKPTQTFTPTTGIIPTDTPIPTTDPTADWKTYNSVEFAFSINYPKDLLIKNFINDQYNRTVSFVGSDINLSIALRKSDSNFNLDKYYFMDSPIARTTTLSSQKANVYEMPNGYCDGPGCSQPYIAIVTEHSGDIYSLSFFGDSKLSSLESQILSTFKFTEPTTSSKEILESSLKKEIYPSSPEKIVIVSTITGNFASGTYKIMLDADGGPGGGWIAAKINNNWKLVEAFQEPPSCNLMKKYNVPISIYGTCINKYTLSEAKSACVALQGQKAWDSNFNECNEAGTTRDQLKKLCDQYGGVFYPDSSTCRHTDFYGLPCGPEATYYCSFANLK